MKSHFKKTIACLLTMLMLFASVQVGVSAVYNAGADGAVDYSGFYNADSVRSATTDQIATILLDYGDAFLGRYGEYLMQDIQEEAPALALDLTSVDHALSSVISFLNSGKLTGDVGNLNTAALQGKTRSEGDLKLMYAALQFIADNSAVFSKLLTGNFDFGNFFSFFGVPEEDAQEIIDSFHSFDVYTLVKAALDIDDETTIDEWINTTLNGFIQEFEIGGTTAYDDETGEEIHQDGIHLDIEIDVTTQSLYEIIDALLEAVVRAITMKIAGTTFSEDATMGDYLAAMVDELLNQALEAVNAAGANISVKEDSLYEIIKKAVDALITGNRDAIDAALNQLNEGLTQVLTKAGNSYVFLAQLIGYQNYQELALSADCYDDVVAAAREQNADLTEVVSVDYNGVTYVVAENLNYEDAEGNEQILAGLHVFDVTTQFEEYKAQLLSQVDEDNGDAMMLKALMDVLAVLNTAPHFSVEQFGLIENHDTYLGFVGELNHIFYVFLNELFNETAASEIGWTDGGLELLSANLWKFAKWFIGTDAYYAIIRLLAFSDSGHNKYIQDAEQEPVRMNMLGLLLAEETDAMIKEALQNGDGITDLVPPIVNALMLVQTESGNTLGDEWGYQQASSVQEIIAFFLNVAIKNMLQWDFNYDDVIFENGSYAEMTKQQWNETILTMLVDMAYYALLSVLPSEISEMLGFGMTFEEYKAKNWNHLEALDELCDWLLFFIDGLLPATDGLAGERGILDGQGPWYKISKILNSLLPLGIIGGCEKTYENGESFAFDIGVFVEDIIFGGLMNLDIGRILSLFTMNTSPNNFFYVHSLFDAVVACVQHLVNGVFPDTLTDELTDSMLTAITAENLIQLLRNLAASVSGRGVKLEMLAAKLVRFFMSAQIAVTENEAAANPEDAAEDPESYEIPNIVYKLAMIESLEQAVVLLLNEYVIKETTIIEKIIDLGDEEEASSIIDKIIDDSDDDGSNSARPVRRRVVKNVEINAFPYSYDDEIYTQDGKFLEKDREYWKNLAFDICADILTFVLIHALPDDAGFIDLETFDAYKNAGWGWEDCLDEIADWLLSFLHGFIPAIDDMSIERGVLDGQGAFYKLSKVFNSLLPMSIINDCSKTYDNGEVMPFDFGVLLDKIYDAITELNIRGITDMIDENDDAANPFSGNTLVKAVLIVIQNLVNGILPGTIEDNMLISIDDTLRASKLAKIAQNLLKSVNNRKAYLIPSIIHVMQQNDLFDFLLPWLQCNTQHSFEKVERDLQEVGTCIVPKKYKDVCTNCGFTFDYEYSEEKAIGYHTDLDKNGICDICGSYTFGEPREYYDEYGQVWYEPVQCYHEGATHVSEAVAATCTEDGTTGDTFCVVCGSMIVQGTISPKTGHSYGDWITVKEATDTEPGLQKKVCVVCGDEVTREIEKLESIVYTDPETNVSIAYDEDAFDGEMVLEVEEIDTGDPNARAWTIVPTVNGEKVQPNKPVQIKLPIPTDWKAEGITVVHVDEYGIVDYPEFEVVSGYVVLWVSTFSEYRLSYQGAATDKVAGDINGDGKVNNKDLNRLMKYLSGEEVSVEAAALDVNGDGKVNNKDLNRLMKYLSGEDVEIFIS